MDVKDERLAMIENEVMEVAKDGSLFTANLLRGKIRRNYYVLRPVIENMVANGKLEQLNGFGDRKYYRIKDLGNRDV